MAGVFYNRSRYKITPTTIYGFPQSAFAKADLNDERTLELSNPYF
jgi:hypothetical protein